MATCNFPQVKTSRYYTGGLNSEYDEAEIDFEYHGEIDNIIFALEQKYDWFAYEKYLRDDGKIFACREIDVKYGGTEFTIELDAVVYAGYYAGWVFDVKSTVRIGFDEYDLELGYDFDPSIIIDDNWCDNLGLSKIQAKNIAKKIDGIFRAEESNAEKAFAEWCEDELQVSARFSNGETWYSKCN